MKIIIMLDDAVDGNFVYKNSSNSLRHLAFSPLSCISTVDKGFSSYANSVDHRFQSVSTVPSQF